jgi:membrane-associated phospholipid phosphatase
VLVLFVAFLAALVVGVLTASVAWRVPAVDVASPGGPVRRVGRALFRHRELAATLRRRTEPGAVTGLALSFGFVVVALGGVALVFQAYFTDLSNALVDMDRSVARWGAAQATGFSTSVLRAVTELGSTVPVIAIVVGVGLIEFQRVPSRALVPFLGLVVVGQNLIVNVIKEMVDRVRPDLDRLAAFSGPSFPSGHSATAAACFAALALLLGRRRSPAVQIALAGGAAAIAVAVAASRVLLGVHWLTDAIVGLAVGWTWFALCAIAFGGRLLHFGTPVEMAVRADEMVRDHGTHARPGEPTDQSELTPSSSTANRSV